MLQFLSMIRCRTERVNSRIDSVLHRKLSKIIRERCLSNEEIKEFVRAPSLHDRQSIISLVLKQRGETLSKLSKRSLRKLSLLWIAVLGSYYASAELLVRSGADINEIFSSHDDPMAEESPTILHALLLKDKSSKNEQLIRLITDLGACLEIPDSNKGQTALHLAVSTGRVKVAKMLLEKGAYVNAVNYKGVTPLLEAAASYKAHELIPLLMEYGADISAKDVNGENALHWISRARVTRIDIAKFFIDLGISLHDRQFYDLRQPIHVAAISGNSELVNLFLDHGAEINSKIKFGYFPLNLAVINGNPEVVNILLQRGANVMDKTTLEGRTALHNACENVLAFGEDVQEMNIRLLLSAGADVLVEDREGRTPFSLINFHYDTQKSGTRMILRELALCKADEPEKPLKDERIIQLFPNMKKYYQECIKQIGSD